MSDSNSSQNLDINAAAQYIAEETRKIVNAMKELDKSQSSTFEEDVKNLSQKAEIEKIKNQQELYEKREQIRQRFHGKRKRH